MIIGIPKEIKDGESRVALTPAGAHVLVRDGHVVLVEKSAGRGSGLSDDEYAAVGAEVSDSSAEIYASAEFIVKVKEPLEHEWSLLRPGQLLFTYLHLASSRELTEALLKQKVIAVAYETVQDSRQGLPLLTPMSEVAGRMSVQVAARFLEAHHGGRGILLGGVPGVPPAEVVVLGGGIVGANAARIAIGLGARVTLLDNSLERLKYIDDITHGVISTVYSTPYTIENTLKQADVLIGAVLVTGARAPVLVSKEMVSNMKPGAVIVDVAVDQGGCVETIRPTTHTDPVYTIDRVIHYGVPNIPAAVPRTSTYALTNATLPYIRTIASKGIKAAAMDDELLAQGINCAQGELTNRAVAEFVQGTWRPWSQILK